VFLLLLLFLSTHLYSANFNDSENFNVWYDVKNKKEFVIQIGLLNTILKQRCCDVYESICSEVDSCIAVALIMYSKHNTWMQTDVDEIIDRLKLRIPDEKRPLHQNIDDLCYLRVLEKENIAAAFPHAKSYDVMLQASLDCNEYILREQSNVRTTGVSVLRYVDSSLLILKKVLGAEETDSPGEQSSFLVPEDYNKPVLLDLMTAMPETDRVLSQFSDFSVGFLEYFVKKMNCFPELSCSLNPLDSVRSYEEAGLRLWLGQSTFLSDHVAALKMYGVDVDAGDSFSETISFDEDDQKWKILLPTRDQMICCHDSLGHKSATFSVQINGSELFVETIMPSVGEQSFNSMNVIENLRCEMRCHLPCYDKCLQGSTDQASAGIQRSPKMQQLCLFWEDWQKEQVGPQGREEPEVQLFIEPLHLSRQANQEKSHLLFKARRVKLKARKEKLKESFQ